jgi:TolA-binding protein
MIKDPRKKSTSLAYRIVDKLKAIKEHPIIIIIALSVSLIIGIANFTDAVGKIKAFMKRSGPSSSISQVAQTPTPENRVGIWVARIRGDDDQFSAQRELVQNLDIYLEKDPTLKNLVEVRELTQEITGTTESQREALANAAGEQVHAAMIILGEIVGLLKVGEFFPRITIIGSIKPREPTFRLETITDILRSEELVIRLPSTSRVAPERIREPIRFARFIIAVQHYKKDRWFEAAEQFEGLIREQPHEAYASDVHFYAGFSYFKLYLIKKGSKDLLLKAHAHFLNAQKASEGHEEWITYPNVLNALGITSVWMSYSEVSPQPFLEEAQRYIKEAARLWKERGDDPGYWKAEANLALVFRILAYRGIDPEHNFSLSLSSNEQIADTAMKRGEWVLYSVSKVNTGYLLLEAAKRGIAVVANLEAAVQQFQNATRHNKTHSLSGTYLAGESGLAGALVELLRLEVGISKNLPKCLAAWEEVANIFSEHKQWENYADVQIEIFKTLTDVAEKGIDVNGNMTKAITAGKEAALRYSDLRQWDKYESAQRNVSVAHGNLAQRNINRLANLQQMKMVLEDGIEMFHKYGFSDQENRFKVMLEPVSKALAGGEKHAGVHQIFPGNTSACMMVGAT